MLLPISECTRQKRMFTLFLVFKRLNNPEIKYHMRGISIYARILKLNLKKQDVKV